MVAASLELALNTIVRAERINGVEKLSLTMLTRR